MHGVFVRGQITIAQQSAMNHGMECLDAAIHHLWKFCQLRDIFDGNARRANGFMRAARGD